MWPLLFPFLFPQPECNLEELTRQAYLDSQKTAIVQESDSSYNHSNPYISNLNTIQPAQRENSNLNESNVNLSFETGIISKTKKLPKYEQIPTVLYGYYTDDFYGLYTGFTSEYPRPNWFSSDAEIDAINDVIINLGSATSFNDYIQQFNSFSKEGKIFALESLMALLYNHNANLKRDYNENLTLEQMFTALRDSYPLSAIPSGVCADFSYFTSEAAELLGFKASEMDVTVIPVQPTPHMVSLLYDDEYGFIIIDRQNIIFSNTFNRELAKKIYQNNEGVISLIDEIYHGSMLLQQFSDEGTIIAQAFEYNDAINALKEKMLNPKNYATEISGGYYPNSIFY